MMLCGVARHSAAEVWILIQVRSTDHHSHQTVHFKREIAENFVQAHANDVQEASGRFFSAPINVACAGMGEH